MKYSLIRFKEKKIEKLQATQMSEAAKNVYKKKNL